MARERGDRAASNIADGRWPAELLAYAAGVIDRDLLDETFGGSRFISASRNERAQPLHSWQIVDRMAATFLTAIGPSLRIKRSQAELCSELRRLKDQVGRRLSRTAVATRGGGPRRRSWPRQRGSPS